MAEETRIEAVGCALHPFERNRYFYGKLLTVRDFETDQGYMIGKDHLINSHVHGSGIVCGLELTDPQVENDILSVNLTAGVALDCCGNEIVVSKSTNNLRVRGTPQEGLNYVYLCYAECVKEPVPALAKSSTCEEVCCYNRIQETYEVRISPEPPVRTDAAFVGKVQQRQASGAPAPLAGARIEALQNGMVRAATLTNETGNYRLKVVAGTYDVRASATGYQAVTENNRSVAAGGNPSIDFVLEPAADRPDAVTLCQDMTQRYYEEHLRVCPQCAAPKVLLAVVNLPRDGQPSVDPEETQRHRSIVYSNPMLHDLLCDHVADFHNPHGTTAADILALQSINNVGNVEGRPHVSNVDLISSNSTIQIDPHPDTQRIDITTTPATTVTSAGPTPAVGSSLHFAREDHVHDLADEVVSTRTLANNAVTGPKIADNAITSPKIADNAITSPKIADGTIQLGDLHPDLRRGLGRGVNVRTFGATGDGSTNDREAIQSALEAAAGRGDEVYFPPGTYIVGRSGSNPWCLEMPGDNLTLHGVKGASWIKADRGMPEDVVVLWINGRSNITLSGLGIDGNWGNALTEITAASDGVELGTPEAGTIHVKSTEDFPRPAGTIQVMTSVGVTQTVHYTGVTETVTETSFTGCIGGTGTMFRGGVVGRLDDQTGINHAPQGDPQNHGIQIFGSTKILIDNCLIQQTYGDGIWLGALKGDEHVWTQDVRITNTNVNITARNGISFGQACEGIYIGHTNFTNIFAQAVDAEPGDQPVRDVVVEHCHLGGWWNPGHPDPGNPNNPGRAGNTPLSIVGGKDQTGGQTVWARKFRVRDCTIDGACAIHSAVDVVLERNRIVTDFHGNSYAPVLVSHFCDDIWVLDNEIYDRTADATGDIRDTIGISKRHWGAITVRFDGGAPEPGRPSSTTMQPSGVTVRGNRIHARNGRHGIAIVGTGARALAHDFIEPGSPSKLLPDETGVASTVTATTLTRKRELETEITAASDGVELGTPEAGTIHVKSTDGFPKAGTIKVEIRGGMAQRVQYTGVTLTSFTGCTGGTGTMFKDDKVTPAWADNQWQGRFVRIGEATAGIVFNDADTLTLYVPGFHLQTAWYTPLGAPVVTPAEGGTYEIYGIGGVIDIDGNDIDCTNDGHGAGGMGIHLLAAHAGMRVRCRNNKIKNASGDAIKVESVDEHRPFLHLVIAHNHAWDDQRNRTCTTAVRFTSPRHIDRLVLCGNSVEGAITPVEGLDSGVWLVEEGLPERWVGWGNPNGVIAAHIGAMYQQLKPGVSALWVKQADDGQKTGWMGVDAARGVNVRTFGATGGGVKDDGSFIDDREAIQRAINAAIAAGGGVVFFPAGNYVVGKNPNESFGASFFIDGESPPLVFEGEGAASRILMDPGPSVPAGNWAMFRVREAENVSFRHLLLDGNRPKIPSPSDGTEIDCIVLEQAVDVTVQNVEFRRASVNSIRIEGGGAEAAPGRLKIVDNLFDDAGRSEIQLDGSTGVVIQGNIVRHTSLQNAVQLGDTSRVQFVSNTILRGQVLFRNVQDFVISNNMIVQGEVEHDAAVLTLEGAALNGAVTGNIIHAERTSTSTGIHLAFRGESPQKIRLSQNTIVAGHTGINMSGQDISVSDNVIESYSETNARLGEVGISVGRLRGGPLGDAIQVRNNHIRGFERGIRAVGDNTLGLEVDLTRLMVVGNQIRGSSVGAILIGPRVQAATVHGNQAAPGEIPLFLETDSYIVTAVGFAGNKPPQAPGVEVVAEVGSFYTQLEGSPSLWVKERSGTDGWVQWVPRGT
jgi:hypothetical protein